MGLFIADEQKVGLLMSIFPSFLKSKVVVEDFLNILRNKLYSNNCFHRKILIYITD